MATENKKYIPALRFPEFQNDGEWEADTMETIFDIKNGYTPSKSNPSFWDNGTIPWFRMEDIRKNGHILSDSIQHVTPAAVKNAGLFPAYSIIVATTATIGEHALIIVDSLANQQFTFLTKRKSFDNKLDMMYFHYFMFIIDEWCKKNTNAGGLLSVNMDSFKKLTIPYPSSLSEQKKIADCFVSIDKEIDAAKRKLELLKEHKRGLMQCLFPAKGKTTPELRFPEFQNDGEWALTPIGKYYKVQGGFAFKSSEFKKSGIPIIRILNIPNDGIYIETNDSVYYDTIMNEDNFLISRGDLLIAMSGATTGKTAVYNQIGKAYLNQRVGLFKSTNSHNYYPFICQWVKSNYFYAQLKRTLAAGAQPNISSKDIESFIWAYPNGNNSFAEQKKIADCLSSLDKYIDAAKRKLELLKEHKKGLMQQLFPKL